MADILTPTLGESVAEGAIAKWNKKSGDSVKKDEVLVEIETDKVSLEVAAPADGVLQILVGEGETVTPGMVLGTVGGAAAAAPKAEAPKAADAPKAAPAAAAALIEVKTPVMGESVAEGAIGKRDPMLAAGLHALPRNHPEARPDVDFRPSSADDLAGA